VFDETAADGTTPPASASRFTARSLQDLLALLRRFQDQSGSPESALPGVAETAGTQD
jgi:hypothetical protein